MELATTLPASDGIARERQIFREAAASPYARALQYAFFAERQAANLPGIGADVKPREVASVGILGAGTMGTGITIAFLNGGYPVRDLPGTAQSLRQKELKEPRDRPGRGRVVEGGAQEL